MPNPQKPAKSKPSALAIATEALPGEVREDATLIETTIAAVNSAYIGGGLQTMRSVGQIVLDGMFDGDVDKFRSTEKHHVSYRALGKHPDIRVSSSGLWYAVAIVDNCRVLGASAELIDVSKHRKLVHLGNKAQRVELARRTINEKMTVKALEAEIRAISPPAEGSPKRGRPAMAPAVRQWQAVKRAVSELAEPSEESLEGADTQQRAAMLIEAEALQGAITAWLGQLRVAVRSRAQVAG